MTTPMMQQYHDIKDQYSDCFLLYRLGDFYELFCEDAIEASAILGITLTKRGEHVPMCGIPFHSADNYIKKLLDLGHKVAICEQMEAPKPGQKGPVKREVVRILTPGTLTENMNDDSNYLVVFSPEHKQKCGVAICDVSTGFLRTETTQVKDIDHILAKYRPKETIAPESLKDYFKRVYFMPDSRFNLQNCRDYLVKHFNNLECFGDFESVEIQATGFLIDYVFITQKQALKHITKIQKYDSIQYLFMNASTRQSLEIMKTMGGQYEGSLVHTINHTKTALGKRMLVDRINNPLMNVTAINKRLDEIEFFIKYTDLMQIIRTHLQHFPDMERCLSRLSLNRGGPKDMRSILVALEKADVILSDSCHPGASVTRTRDPLKAFIHNGDDVDFEYNSEWIPDHRLSASSGMTSVLTNLQMLLTQALKEDVPVYAKDGGFIKDGFSVKLDEQRHLQRNAAGLIQALEDRYRAETNIPNLKIKFNNVWGYFVEISQSHVGKIKEPFVLKQTLTNGCRYMTEELSLLQDKILRAQKESLEEELLLFEQLRLQILEILPLLQELSFEIARIDVATSMAYLATLKNYTRPIIDESSTFNIQQGRYPALDKDFTPNDCVLEGLHIITGPNMGGKSTYLRQNALIVIMAQAGFYVPCALAHVGLVDKVMTRIGASDDISQGKSTFMVEMTEMSSILHLATPKSLVILDEVGRGTSTADGLAIARAICDYLLTHNKSKVLFATHYHELSTLQHPLVKFYHVLIQEWNGAIVFLHKIAEGFCDKSYGVHVAEMAGFPKEVVEKARAFAL